MATTRDLTDYLDRNEVEYTRLAHGPGLTARELAAATLVPQSSIAQTLLVRADGHFWMVVIPANREMDPKELARLLEAKELREADKTDILFYLPECTVHLVPPFGNLYGMPVIADEKLRETGRILFCACSTRESIFMRWQDYQRLVRPIVAEFTRPCDAPKAPDECRNQDKKDQEWHEALHAKPWS